MILKDLVKGQKQMLVLGAIGAVALVSLAVVGIRFSLSSVAKAKEELLDLSSKIKTADNVLSKSSNTSSDYDGSVKILKECLDKIPPERDYYSWASQVIYATAKATGLEVDSIDEMSAPGSRAAGKKDDIGFRSYSLRITARGGYAQTKHFISRIEHDQPLARFPGMEISSGSSPDSHNVQLFLQWPFNLSTLEELWDEVESKKKSIALKSSYGRNKAESELEMHGAAGAEDSGSNTLPPKDAPETPDGSDINFHQNGAKYALLGNNAKGEGSFNKHDSRKFVASKNVSSQRVAGGYQ